MKLWLITKQMENPVSGSAYQALMDEFLNGYYGAAGPYVKQYLDYMHEKAEAYDGAQNFGAHIIGAEWLHAQDIIAGEDFFDAAFEAAVSNETLLRRLRAARSGFDRVVIENFARWTSEALKRSWISPSAVRRSASACTPSFPSRSRCAETTTARVRSSSSATAAILTHVLRFRRLWRASIPYTFMTLPAPTSRRPTAIRS